MQPSSGHQQRPLPAAVFAELARLEAEVGQAADPLARARLADLGEAAEIRVLRRRAWEQRHAVRSLSAYINNAPGLGLPCAVNAARQAGLSVVLQLILETPLNEPESAEKTPPNRPSLPAVTFLAYSHDICWPIPQSQQHRSVVLSYPFGTDAAAAVAVAAELARLESQLGQVSDGLLARRSLVELGEAAALSALQKIGKSREVRTLSGYILWVAKREAAPPTNAPGAAAVESAACSPSASLRKGESCRSSHGMLMVESQGLEAHLAAMALNVDAVAPAMASLVDQMPPKQHESATQAMVSIVPHGVIVQAGHQGSSSTQPELQQDTWAGSSDEQSVSSRSHHVLRCFQGVGPLRNPLGSECAIMLPKPAPNTIVVENALRQTSSQTTENAQTESPQMQALGGLEFTKRFLIISYLCQNKIENEDALTLDYIESLKTLPMASNRAASERTKSLDSDPSTAKVYHCNYMIRANSEEKVFKVCEHFMVGFPLWWQSCNLRYPKPTNLDTACQPCPSNTSNSGLDSTHFYLEKFQLGEFLDSYRTSSISKHPDIFRSFSRNDSVFPKSSHLSNGTPRFEEYTCDGDIATNENAAASSEAGKGGQTTPVVTLEVRGCCKETQHMALTEKAAVDEEMPTSVYLDVENSFFLSNGTPVLEEYTCDGDIPTNEDPAASNDDNERYTVPSKEVNNVEIGLIAGSTSSEKGRDDIATDVSLAPTVECTNNTVSEAVDCTPATGTYRKKTPVASLKSQGSWG